MNERDSAVANISKDWLLTEEYLIPTPSSEISEDPEDNSEPEIEKDFFIKAEEITELPQFDESKKYSIGLPKDIIYRLDLSILDEEFLIELEDDKFFITHPSWSLCGEGPDLLSAELNLLSEAKEVLTIIKDESDSNLSIETIRMRDFLFRLV